MKKEVRRWHSGSTAAVPQRMFFMTLVRTSQYLFVGLQVGGDLQEVMSEGRVVWDLPKAEQRRLGEVHHEPGDHIDTESTHTET